MVMRRRALRKLLLEASKTAMEFLQWYVISWEADDDSSCRKDSWLLSALYVNCKENPV